jgi:hypothetical protein
MSPTTLFFGLLVFVWLAKFGMIDRLLYALSASMAPGSPANGAPQGGGGNCAAGKTCEQMRAELCGAHYPGCSTASCKVIETVYAATCK